MTSITTIVIVAYCMLKMLYAGTENAVLGAIYATRTIICVCVGPRSIPHMFARDASAWP